MNILETARLILRTWKEKDIEPYFQINQDPRVTEFLLGPLTREQVEDFITRMNQQFAQKKFTNFALEEKASGKLIGFVGLNVPTWQAHFTPCVEIGWRLGAPFWRQGYATEGAKAVLEYAFNVLNLPEIVSFTVPANVRSICVMERIGMQRDLQGDFAHPKLAPDHPFSKHVLYRIKNKNYENF